MRLAIASDLHAEFSGHRLAIPKPEADAWLLAGDIGVGMEAILWIRKALPAGDLVNFVAEQVGGKGGGRPDMAQAGGSDASKLDEALESVYGWIEQRLG